MTDGIAVYFFLSQAEHFALVKRAFQKLDRITALVRRHGISQSVTRRRLNTSLCPGCTDGESCHEQHCSYPYLTLLVHRLSP